MLHLPRLSQGRTQGRPKCADTDARSVGDSHHSWLMPKNLPVCVLVRDTEMYVPISANVVAYWSTINCVTTSSLYLDIHLESFVSLWTKVDFANSFFGKIGHNAPEEVLFALIKLKCLPILLHGIEASCQKNSTDLQSLFSRRPLVGEAGGYSDEQFRTSVCVCI